MCRTVFKRLERNRYENETLSRYLRVREAEFFTTQVEDSVTSYSFVT